MAPVLLQDYRRPTCLVLLQTLLMHSQHIYKIARYVVISFPVNPINPRNGEQIKSSTVVCIHIFVTTTLGKQFDEERLGKN